MLCCLDGSYVLNCDFDYDALRGAEAEGETNASRNSSNYDLPTSKNIDGISLILRWDHASMDIDRLSGSLHC